VDVRKCSFLDSQLAAAVRVSPRAPSYPVLDRGFESSVPALRVVGAPAMESFGPLMRFVARTGYAVRAVTRRVAGAALAAPVAIDAWHGARRLTSRIGNGV
jgi:FAD-dependent urate hydroxylase